MRNRKKVRIVKKLFTDKKQSDIILISKRNCFPVRRDSYE